MSSISKALSNECKFRLEKPDLSMDDIECMGLANRPISNREAGVKAVSARKRKLAQGLNLNVIYTPRVYMTSLATVGNKLHYAVSLPKGQVTSFRLKSAPVREYKKGYKFHYLDQKIGVNQFRERVTTLSDLLYHAANRGIGNNSLKALKRLSMIGFSCPYKTFLQMSNYLYRELYRVGARKKIRRPDYHPKGGMYPSLTGSWKSVCKGQLWVPLWDWKKPATVSKTSWETR